MNEPPVLPGAEPFRFGGEPTGVLMIHGFSGSPTSTRPLGRWLADQGLSVVGVRLPGHGTSEADLRARRWSEWVETVDGGLTDLRARCDTVVVFGQSFGASLALHVATTRPHEVDGLVLASPYVFDARHAMIPIGRLFLRSVKGFGRGDIHKPGQDEQAYARLPVPAVATMAELMRVVRSELPRIRTPALVFRPGEDHTIPRSNPDRVFAALGSDRKELIDCPSSYHVISLDHDAPMLGERTLAFARELAATRGA